MEPQRLHSQDPSNWLHFLQALPEGLKPFSLKFKFQQALSLPPSPYFERFDWQPFHISISAEQIELDVEPELGSVGQSLSAQPQLILPQPP